ncbi:hypothetical protein [Paenibacillus macerans]
MRFTAANLDQPAGIKSGAETHLQAGDLIAGHPA